MAKQSNYIRKIYRFLRNRYYMTKSLPSVFGFEMTTKCNSKCPMCARREFKDIPHDDMDFEILEKVIREVKNWYKGKTFFNLTGLSEPTLYPKLVDAVAAIKTQMPQAKVKIITNAINLNEDLSKQLILAGLDQITISLNGVNRSDYLKLTGVDEYDNVKKNLESLIKNREKHNTIYPILNINLKTHQGNTEAIHQTRLLWTNAILQSDVSSTSDILPLTKSANNSSLFASKSRRRYPCRHLWGEVKLDVNGNIYPCDGKVMDYNFREKSELFLGKINETTIKNVYLSQKITYFRNKHIQNNIISLPTCAKCPIWSIFPNVWVMNRFLPILQRKWL
jgi:radical SAM protein with 4Fe4S-binding SPASM domain